MSDLFRNVVNATRVLPFPKKQDMTQEEIAKWYQDSQWGKGQKQPIKQTPAPVKTQAVVPSVERMPTVAEGSEDVDDLENLKRFQQNKIRLASATQPVEGGGQTFTPVSAPSPYPEETYAQSKKRMLIDGGVTRNTKFGDVTVTGGAEPYREQTPIQAGQATQAYNEQLQRVGRASGFNGDFTEEDRLRGLAVGRGAQPSQDAIDAARSMGIGNVFDKYRDPSAPDGALERGNQELAQGAVQFGAQGTRKERAEKLKKADTAMADYQKRVAEMTQKRSDAKAAKDAKAQELADAKALKQEEARLREEAEKAKAERDAEVTETATQASKDAAKLIADATLKENEAKRYAERRNAIGTKAARREKERQTLIEKQEKGYEGKYSSMVAVDAELESDEKGAWTEVFKNATHSEQITMEKNLGLLETAEQKRAFVKLLIKMKLDKTQAEG